MRGNEDSRLCSDTLVIVLAIAIFMILVIITIYIVNPGKRETSNQFLE